MTIIIVCILLCIIVQDTGAVLSLIGDIQLLHQLVVVTQVYLHTVPHYWAIALVLKMIPGEILVE